MKKRGGYPIIVEIRCGADNGACGTRVIDTGVVLTPEGPIVFSPHAGRLALPHPEEVRLEREARDGRRVPRRTTGGFAGNPLTTSSPPQFVRCPVEGHGRGMVAAEALLKAAKQFRNKTVPVTFIPTDRWGVVWVGDKLVDLDADWWDRQDADSRKRWWDRRAGENTPR